MRMDIELNGIGVKLDINYTPPEKETWGFAGGTPPNDAEFEVIGFEITDPGKLCDQLGDHFAGKIWKQINEELTLKS